MKTFSQLNREYEWNQEREENRRLDEADREERCCGETEGEMDCCADYEPDFEEVLVGMYRRKERRY